MEIKGKWYFIVLAVILALLPYLLNIDIAPQAKAVLSVLLFIATLWITEALQLWLTAMMIPFLLVIVGGIAPKEAYNPFFDPIIALLLGGFILARALQKHGLDVRIAHFFVGLFGTKPKRFLLGMMFATAFMSFWISNTASTLLMIPIAIAALQATKLKPLKSTYAKAVILSIGFAATIGGTATLIGTPPNLIAVRFLKDVGIQLSFLDWIVYALPIAIMMIIFSWLVLSWMYKPEIKEVKAPKIKSKKLSQNQKIVLGVLALTALLWLTENIHGVHNSIIAMVPLFALFGLGLLKKDDLGKVGWNVLLLVGGSLSLAVAMQSSGLSGEIASFLGQLLIGQSIFVIYLVIAAFGVLFTAVATNTGSAAIFIPVVIPLAPILGVNPVGLAVLLGIIVSYDLIVPVGTPPNTISYGTGYITVKDMVKPGIIISSVAILVFSTVATLVW